MHNLHIKLMILLWNYKSKVIGKIINTILLKIILFSKKEVYINMDIRILRYFLTVAKEQNFTKAAEQLNITQPTLSRQLASLEELPV